MWRRQFGSACVRTRVGRMAHVRILKSWPKRRLRRGFADGVISFGGQLENGVSGTTLETSVASRRSHPGQRAPLRA